MASDRSLTARDPWSETPGAEIRALTGLRIVAALWVVVYHFPWAGISSVAGVEQALHPLFRSGWLGVDLFFVLSGFVIAHNYLAKMGPRLSLRGTGAFLWARLARIWPLWALVTTGFWFWLLAKSWLLPVGVNVYQRVPVPLGVGSWLQQLLMVQVWYQPTIFGTTFVGTGWSLSSEWLAYVCFPLLALGAWRIRRAHPAITGVLAVAVLVPYAYVSYRSGSNVHDWMAVTRIAGGFTAGVLACLAVRRIPRTVRTQRWAAGICTLTLVELGVAILWAEWRSEAFPGADYYGVAIVFLPVLVGSLALSTTGVAAFLSRPVMVHGGRISFALYLVHIAVFEVGRTVADHVQRLGGSTAIGAVLLPQLLIVSVVAAHLLYRYVEEPTRRALRDRTPAGLRRWPAADVPSDVPPAVPPAVPAAREPVSEAA